MLRISRWHFLTEIWLHSMTSACCSSFEVMASCIPNCLSKVSPQIFNGIEIRTLWWPFQTTQVLIRFPLLDNTSYVAWGTIILENKVISMSQKMCWGNGRIPENIRTAILVEVAFQWSKKPSYSEYVQSPTSLFLVGEANCIKSGPVVRVTPSSPINTGLSPILSKVCVWKLFQVIKFVYCFISLSY